MKKLIAVAVTLAVMTAAILFSKLGKAPQVSEVAPPPSPFTVPPPQVVPTRQQARDSITPESCKSIVTYLCSDALEGRMTGKKGNVQAADWLEGRFREAGLQVQRQQFPYKTGVNVGPRNEVGDSHSANVIGVLPGGDRHIIVGAHFDHLGYGPTGSRWGGGKIHPGADDNATGTTLVAEIARACRAMQYQPKHTIVFIGFSGEEMGLVGSQYYVQNPVFPLGKLDFMFNTDMIGRLNGKTSLSVGGSPSLNPFMQRLNGVHPVKLSASQGGGGSDHQPFQAKGIPVACFHTGLHADYHTPGDTADKIDYDGVAKITRYVFDIVLDYDQK